MLTFSHIVGQRQSLERLRRAIAAGKVAHAFLFTGPGGVGKRTTALAFACALNCVEHPGEGCGRCEACAKIAAGSHPDVIVLAPDGRFIKIDQVRALEQRLAFPPHEGRHRVIVIDGAEDLHPSAANALLKSVEEPRSHTLFVLLSAAVHRVVPTLISRCQRLRFVPLAADEVEEVLARQADDEHDAATRRSAAAVAEGSPGRALELLASEQLSTAQAIADEIVATLRRDDAGSVFAAAAGAGRDRALLRQALELLRVRLRDMLLLAVGADEDRLLAGRSAELEPRAHALGPRRLIAQLRAVQGAEAALLGNANAALALETMAFDLRQIGAGIADG